jgi:transposase
LHCLKHWDKQQQRHGRRRNVTCPVCRKVFAAAAASDLSVCIRLRDTIELLLPEQLAERKADVQREAAEQAAAEAAAQERARAAAAERARQTAEEAARAADQAAIYALYGSDDESDESDGDSFAINNFPRLHPALPGAAGKRPLLGRPFHGAC